MVGLEGDLVLHSKSALFLKIEHGFHRKNR